MGLKKIKECGVGNDANQQVISQRTEMNESKVKIYAEIISVNDGTATNGKVKNENEPFGCNLVF